MRGRFAWAVLLAWTVGCGESPPAPVDGGGGTDASLACSGDLACDDGLFCNGIERCDPTGATGDGRGCSPGEPACEVATELCVEDENRCVPRCDVDDDADDDGARAMQCGGTDCDDGDPRRAPSLVEVCDPDDRDEDCNPATYGARDADGDGHDDAACCNDDLGVARCGTDCNDLRRDVSPALLEVCDELDNDCDGATDEELTVVSYEDRDFDLHGDASRSGTACPGHPGWSTVSDDCDDGDPARHGAQLEICDGVDNDCDGMTDEAPAAVPWYPDDDGDGFGTAEDPARVVVSCEPRPAMSLRASDCDDGDADVHPGAGERCNGRDDDCDGRADAIVGGNGEDDDGDGHGDMACGGSDCDDVRADVHAGAPEVCDGRDNDCDGTADGATEDAEWYVDRDGDGFGDGADPAPVVGCDPVAGHVTNGLDCDDASASVHPGALDRCGGGDQDCDGRVDEGAVRTAFWIDADADGWGASGATALSFSCTPPAGATDRSGDCDDSDGDRHPTAVETCDGADEDCDAAIDEDAAQRWYEDDDGDGHGAIAAAPIDACLSPGAGYATTNDDCADTDPLRFPGSTERCDDADQDCDGAVDEGADAACTIPYATASCSAAGACTLSACAADRADCDGAIENGCETDTRSAAGHCGACGTSCGLADTCGRTTPGTCDAAPIVALAAGEAHVHALRATGGVASWGTGWPYGALGVGGDSGSPVATPLADVVQIDAGLEFSCARRRDGTVLCWGRNDFGQLGNGLTIDRAGPTVPVVGITTAIDVSTSTWSGCAVLADGHIRCWGRGEYGRLGDGTVDVTARVPVEVATIDDAVDVSCQDKSCCARRAIDTGGSSVWCWGYNQGGEVGNGTTTSRELTPVPAVGLPPDIVALAEGMGNAHCAIDSSGRAYCWGQNGWNASSSTQPTPVTPIGLDRGVLQISLGPASSSFGCARVQTGTSTFIARCWGYNGLGQYGNGHTITSDVPTRAAGTTDDVLAIATMSQATCILRGGDGQVYCFGDDGPKLGDDGCGTARVSPRAVELPVCGLP